MVYGNKKIVVVGGSNIDICARSDKDVVLKDSNIGEIEFALGGVGRNIAEILSLFGADVSLLTAIGNDSFGHVVEDNAREQDISLLLEPFEGIKTGVYSYICASNGTFIAGVNDMKSTASITPQVIKDNINVLNFSDMVVMEANLNQDTIEELASHDFRLVADSVSGPKCTKLLTVLDKLELLKCNTIELECLTGCKEINDGVKVLVSKGLKHGIVTKSFDGAMCFDVVNGKITTYTIPAVPWVNVVDTIGCSDAFMAGYVMGLLGNHAHDVCLRMGMCASSLNAESVSSVNRKMTYTQLRETFNKFNAEVKMVKEVLD